MDSVTLAATAGSLFFILASVAISTAAVVASDHQDGRSNPAPRTRLWSIRNNTWETVNGDVRYSQGWFRANLRCSQASFDVIAARVKHVWAEYNKPLGKNVIFSIEERVAVTIYYLASGGTMRNAGSLFGMSKSSTVRGKQLLADLRQKQDSHMYSVQSMVPSSAYSDSPIIKAGIAKNSSRLSTYRPSLTIECGL
ncbi:hypothetical protein BDR26DRAFT_901748 [Obelidium mucronatum]|nr:hypothetical protein BDR26DRAFT_901748 [Obelidium mucronatum]